MQALLQAALLSLPLIASASMIEEAPAEAQAQVETTATTLDRRVDTVQAGDTDVWTLTLSAGVNHHIVVDGDGDTDLDIYLYDENGNLLDYDDDLTDYCIVDVTPRWTGTFTLKIVNRGNVWNRYVLTTS